MCVQLNVEIVEINRLVIIIVVSREMSFPTVLLVWQRKRVLAGVINKCCHFLLGRTVAMEGSPRISYRF